MQMKCFLNGRILKSRKNQEDHRLPFLNPIPHGGGGGGGGQILPSFRLSSLQLPLGMQQNHEIW